MCIFCLAEYSSVVAGEMTSSLLHMVMGKYLRRNLTHTSLKYIAGKHLKEREKCLWNAGKFLCESIIIFRPDLSASRPSYRNSGMQSVEKHWHKVYINF